MNQDDTTVPPAFRADLGYLQAQDIGGLMASLLALGAEVFQLKAEVRRLRGALEQRGAVAASDIEAAGQAPAFKAWLAGEQQQFAAVLLDPFSSGAAPDPQA